MADAQPPVTDTAAPPKMAACTNCGYNSPETARSCPRCGISRDAAQKRIDDAEGAKQKAADEQKATDEAAKANDDAAQAEAKTGDAGNADTSPALPKQSAPPQIAAPQPPTQLPQPEIEGVPFVAGEETSSK